MQFCVCSGSRKEKIDNSFLKNGKSLNPPHTSKSCMIALTASMALVSLGSILLFVFGQRAIQAGGQHMKFIKSVTVLSGIAMIPTTFLSILWGISIISSPSSSLA